MGVPDNNFGVVGITTPGTLQELFHDILISVNCFDALMLFKTVVDGIYFRTP